MDTKICRSSLCHKTKHTRVVNLSGARIPTCWCDVTRGTALLQRERACGVCCIRHGETHTHTFLRVLNDPEKTEKNMLFDLHILCFEWISVWHVYTRGTRKGTVMVFISGKSFSAMLRFLTPLLVGLFSQSVTTGKMCVFL